MESEKRERAKWRVINNADFGKDMVTTIEIVAELANKSAHDYFDV